MSDKYQYKGPPHWSHQKKALRLSAHKEAFALLMEQGTGKSRVIVDTAGLLYSRDHIDALVVLAPEGVQRAWVNDSIPQYLSDKVPRVAAWLKNKMNKAHGQRYEALWEDRFKGLRVLTVNYETMATKNGMLELRRFLKRFRTLLVADESHKIKTPRRTRTERALQLSGMAPFRRILTGTPVTKTPFDIYSQMLFLDKDIIDIDSFVAFKAEYAELEDNERFLLHIRRKLNDKYGEKRAAKLMPTLVKKDDITGQPCYRNLDKLADKIAPHVFRVRKDECMDLPPKVFVRRYVELNPEQRRIYNELKEDFFTEFAGRSVVAQLAMTRLLRLQQVVGGFLKPDPATSEIAIGASPKLADVLDILEDAPESKVLIWARFRAELELIATTLRTEYSAASVAVYWGGQSDKKHDAEKLRFIRDPYCRFFVANPQSAGTGLDGLQVANVEVFYSNSFSLTDRLQAEDRGHRGGSEQHDKVTIYDIEAEDTLDRKIIETLRANQEVSNMILRDDPRNWI